MSDERRGHGEQGCIFFPYSPSRGGGNFFKTVGKVGEGFQVFAVFLFFKELFSIFVLKSGEVFQEGDGNFFKIWKEYTPLCLNQERLYFSYIQMENLFMRIVIVTMHFIVVPNVTMQYLFKECRTQKLKISLFLSSQSPCITHFCLKCNNATSFWRMQNITIVNLTCIFHK